MATRSTIALEHADGSVQQIYCHWDGYLEHNGKILYNHYSDPSRVQKLMDLGDLSSLHEDIGDEVEFDEPLDYELEACIFYGRDRGEYDTDARWFKSYEHYCNERQTEDYNYLLRADGSWYVDHYDKYNGPLADLVN